MKHFFTIITFLTFSACATTYDRAARSEYIGNGVYEVRADGNKWTNGDDVRGFLYRKAYETCAAESKGFEIVKSEDTTSHGVSSDGYGNVYSTRFPGARLMVKCTGEVDPKLTEKYKTTPRS